MDRLDNYHSYPDDLPLHSWTPTSPDMTPETSSLRNVKRSGLMCHYCTKHKGT